MHVPPAAADTSVQVKMAPRQGVIAIAYGPSPTRIGEPGVFVAVAIGTTRPGSRQTTTYAVVPSGVIAVARAPSPTAIGGPGVLVAVVIGVTVNGPVLAS
jgi:hypothetical protein